MLTLVIIDDEARVRSVIRQTLQKRPDKVRIIAEADSVASGLDTLTKYKPDIVLLDIKFPDGLAFDILKHFEDIPFKIIFITAYNDFAIDAFRLSAVDYLLKPVSANTLWEAIDKAENLLTGELLTRINALTNNYLTSDPNGKQILLKTIDNIFLVKIADIIHCEAEHTYCRFHLQGDERILVSKPMGDYEDMLKEYEFFRVHKSYIVNLRQIKKYSKSDGGSLTMMNGSVIPVSVRKKDTLLAKISNLS
jgi:two-component system LytT family response regulator